jgi:hypothetical protein
MRYQTITIGAALMAATLLAGGCGRVSESSAATPSTATPRTTTAVALYNEYMPVRHDEIAQLEMYGARHIPIDGIVIRAWVNEADQPIIRLGAHADGPEFCEVYVSHSQSALVEGLRRGDAVTIKGNPIGFDFDGRFIMIMGAKVTSSPPARATPSAGLQSMTDFTAWVLYETYRADETAAMGTYNDMIVDVTGVVVKTWIDDSGEHVVGIGRFDGGPIVCEAYFAKSDAAVIEPLLQGTEVTVRGRSIGLDFHAKHCTLKTPTELVRP